MKELNDKLIESYDRILKLDRDKLFQTVPGHSLYKECPDRFKYKSSWELDHDWGLVLDRLATSFIRSKRRSKSMNFTHNLTLPYLVELWIQQQGRCAISGLALGTTRGNIYDKNPFACSIDRINSNIGYNQGNVRLLTHWINNALNTYPDEIFNYFVEQTIKHKQQTLYNTGD